MIKTPIEWMNTIGFTLELVDADGLSLDRDAYEEIVSRINAQEALVAALGEDRKQDGYFQWRVFLHRNRSPQVG